MLTKWRMKRMVPFWWASMKQPPSDQWFEVKKFLIELVEIINNSTHHHNDPQKTQTRAHWHTHTHTRFASRKNEIFTWSQNFRFQVHFVIRSGRLCEIQFRVSVCYAKMWTTSNCSFATQTCVFCSKHATAFLFEKVPKRFKSRLQTNHWTNRHDERRWCLSVIGYCCCFSDNPLDTQRHSFAHTDLIWCYSLM